MEIRELSEELFSTTLKERIVGGFSSSIDEHIFNIFNENRDQNVYYEVKFDVFFDDMQKDRYESFGIFVDRDRLSRNRDHRNYLLIVDPAGEKENIIKNCQSFVSMYLPEGKLPNYFVVNKKIESYEELVEWNNLIVDQYPGIMSLNDHNNLKQERTSRLVLSEALEDLKSIGKKPLDVSKYVMKILEVRNNNPSSALTIFKEVCHEVLSLVDKNTVLVTDGRNSDIACVFCAYMFYSYNIQSHLGEVDNAKMMSNISTMLFDRNHMLAEKQIEYINNLPSIALCFNDTSEFWVILYKNNMSCRVTIRYTRADIDDGPLNRMEVDIKDLAIIPLANEYPMNDTDINVIRKEHSELSKIQKRLEDKCNLYSETVNVTNSFFFEENEVTYIAKIDSWDLNLPVSIIPNRPDLQPAKTILKMKDLSRLYPVNVLPGYEAPTKKLNSSMRNRGYEIVKWDLPKINNPLGLVLLRMNANNPSVVPSMGNLSFMELGLWWEETSKYRSVLVKQFSKSINIKDFRKKSEFLTVFGGPHPSFNDSFIVTEEILRE